MTGEMGPWPEQGDGKRADPFRFRSPLVNGAGTDPSDWARGGERGPLHAWRGPAQCGAVSQAGHSLRRMPGDAAADIAIPTLMIGGREADEVLGALLSDAAATAVHARDTLGTLRVRISALGSAGAGEAGADMEPPSSRPARDPGRSAATDASAAGAGLQRRELELFVPPASRETMAKYTAVHGGDASGLFVAVMTHLQQEATGAHAQRARHGAGAAGSGTDGGDAVNAAEARGDETIARQAAQQEKVVATEAPRIAAASPPPHLRDDTEL